MMVRVRFFASLADLTGTSTETMEIDESASITELWASLVERHPALGDMSYRPMVACDLAYATWKTQLAGVEEVAFLPPVSGG